MNKLNFSLGITSHLQSMQPRRWQFYQTPWDWSGAPTWSLFGAESLRVRLQELEGQQSSELFLNLLQCCKTKQFGWINESKHRFSIFFCSLALALFHTFTICTKSQYFTVLYIILFHICSSVLVGGNMWGKLMKIVLHHLMEILCTCSLYMTLWLLHTVHVFGVTSCSTLNCLVFKICKTYKSAFLLMKWLIHSHFQLVTYRCLVAPSLFNLQGRLIDCHRRPALLQTHQTAEYKEKREEREREKRKLTIWRNDFSVWMDRAQDFHPWEQGSCPRWTSFLTYVVIWS